MTKVCEGCGRAYTSRRVMQRYCRIACMPTAVKRAAAIKGRPKATRTSRLRRFGLDIKRLPPTLTREDLLVIFTDIYERGYHSGYTKATWRHINRAKVA